MLTAPTDKNNPDFTPLAGSPVRSGYATPPGGFFSPVDYIGGVDPDDDWLEGWTTADIN